MTKLVIVPTTVKAAIKLVKLWHRHLPDIHGGLFAASVRVDDVVVGTAIAGHPARVWQGTGRIVISRVAAAPIETPDGQRGYRNACTKLYGALCRAATALGYIEAWTYTLPGEPGDSLRGAGFIEAGYSAGGDHGREGRPRAPAVQGGPKKRWTRVL